MNKKNFKTCNPSFKINLKACLGLVLPTNTATLLSKKIVADF